MPTYVYACDSCETSFEIVQGFNDEKLTHCDCCNNDTLYRVPQAPFCYAVGEARTLQQQAERNSKAMGRAEVAERTAKAKVKRKEAIAKANPPKGGELIKTSGRRPWWRSGKLGTPDSDKPLKLDKLIDPKTGEVEPKKTKEFIERGVI